MHRYGSSVCQLVLLQFFEILIEKTSKNHHILPPSLNKFVVIGSPNTSACCLFSLWIFVIALITRLVVACSAVGVAAKTLVQFSQVQRLCSD